MHTSLTRVGFLLFSDIQLLVLAGLYEIFAALPDCVIHLFRKTLGPLACSAGMLFHPTTTLGDFYQLTVELGCAAPSIYRSVTGYLRIPLSSIDMLSTN